MTNDDEKTDAPSPAPYVTIAERRAIRQKEQDARLDAARAEMETMIESPPENGETLETLLTRQSHILHGLFRQTLVARATPEMREADLGLALQMQRECRQSIRTLGRFRCDNRLADKGMIDANTGKRTECPERLYDAAGRLIYDFGKKH